MHHPAAPEARPARRRLLPTALFLALLLGALPGAPAAAGEASLALVQQLLQKGDYRHAKAAARALVKAGPDDESAWLMYETVVRQETRADLRRDPAPTPPDRDAPDRDGLDDPYAGGEPASSRAPEPAAGGPRPAAPGPAPAPAAAEPDLRVDFRAESWEGPVSVAFGGACVKDSEAGIVIEAKKQGTVALSFDLPRFPRKAALALTHRIAGPEKGARMLPLTVKVNDKPLFIRRITVRGKAAETLWPCTDLLKPGANVVEVTLEEAPVRYMLQAFSLKRER